MSSKLKRFLSLLLAFTMVLSIVPVSAEGSGGIVAETEPTESPVARVGSTGGGYKDYTTLKAAFEAAQDGDTIKLLCDVVDEDPVKLSVSDTEVKTITLDLGGYTWDCGYGTRINAVNLTVQNGTIGSDRRNKETFDGKVDVFHFGGHAKLPSTMVVENVTFYAELHVNNMAPSDEELGLLQSTSRSTSRAFNATEVILNSKQYDVVTVQKAAYLTVNGGIFKGGINAEEGSFVTDKRKGETTDSGETVDIEGAKLVTIMAREDYGYTRTERGVTITFVDPTPVETRPYMEFTVGANYTTINVQKLVNGEWQTVTPGNTSTSTYQHTFKECGSVTFRVDWDGNDTYDRLVVLVKAPVAQVGNTYYTSIDEAVANWKDGTTLTLLADATVNLGSPLALLADEEITPEGVNITAAEGKSALEILSGNVTLIVNADSTLTGGKGGAGIYVAEGASVTIKGSGKLTAIGNGGVDTVDSGAAGIGGTYANGNSGAITIDGATVVAKGYGVHGSGIGSGSGKVVGEIKIINGANVTAYGGYYADGAGTKLQSSYGKSDPEGGAAIGGGGKTVSTIANITIDDSTVVAYGGSKAAGIGANFWSSVGTITIGGNSDVTAQGGSSSAGIGTSREGDNGVTANIVISGGKVTATGGAYGAGIGGGYNNDSLGNGADVSALPEITVTISGGTITANGGEGGAGIGGGYKRDNIDIDITGGTVTAQAGALVSGKTIDNGGEASAIGAGANGSGKFENNPAVVIADAATVTATTEFGGKVAIHGNTDENWDAQDNVTIIVKMPVAKNTTTNKEYYDLHDALTECAAGETVILLSDVDLEGVEWEPIGGYDGANHFQGTFDGQGHTIKNLTVTKTDAGSAKTRLALFSAIKNATITNLKIDNAQITAEGSDTRGAVLVMTEEGANSITDITITNSTVDVQSGANGYATGVLGYSDGNISMSGITVSGLTLNVKATETARAAAVVAYLSQADSAVSSLDNFNISNVEITATAPTTYVGGAMGYIQKGNQNVVGIGLTNGTVSGLTIKSNATSAGNVGGLIGMSYKVDPQKVENVNITGLDIDFSGSGSKVGGVIGWDQSVSYNNNNATKKGWYNNVHVSGTINENVTSGSGSEVGGFVGVSHQYPKIYTNCSANVDIVTGNRAGGFVGTPCPNGWSNQTDSYIDCTATGDVTAPVAGGFVGCAWLNNSANTTLLLERVTATGDVKGSSHAGGLIGYAGGSGGCSNIIIRDSLASVNVVGPNEANTAGVVGNSGMASGKFITLENVTWTVEPPINPAEAMKLIVAQVGETKYESLTEAVAAANAIEGGATVELLADVELGEKLTISGNVTIAGEHTITRADDYTGTLFAVNAGATLTLDGGLVIDGNNEYSFNSELYAQDLADWENAVSTAENTKWFTPEEGAPVATAYMITTSGIVNLNDVSIKNHYSTNGSGIVSASKGANVTLDGAQITHNASTNGSGLVVNASAGVWSREEELITVTMNADTVIDGNHVGGNHGIFKIYMGTYFTMNGGVVKNTTGWNSNGVVVGIYHGVFTMNGGTICSNSSVYGPNNGRNGVVYGHSNHLFTMNGGTICHNTGRSKAGVDSPYSEVGYTGQTFINGGTIVDNTVIGPWNEPDVSGGATLTVTGGTFTQDVTEYLAPDLGLETAVRDDGVTVYTVTDDIAEVNGTSYKSVAEAIKAAEAGDTVKVLVSHRVGEPIVVDKAVTIDLNGKTIYMVATVSNKTVFGIAAEGIVLKNGTVDAKNNYAVAVGNSKASGSVTIESGTYIGNVTAAQVTQGTLNIAGGEFKVTDADKTYLLNCIDANYKNGSAKIVVTGGTFYGFNPENNAAEGAETNFCAENYLAEEVETGVWTVRQSLDALDPIVTISFFNTNTNSTMELKYPSERYDTIQKLIGTNDYADFEIGAEQSELLAYVANGTAKDIVMTLHDDVVLDAPINFYNKYFKIPVEYSVTLNLNGHSISSTQDAIVVESGVNLTINGNGAVAGGTSGVGSWTAVWADGGNVTINGGTYSVGGDSNASDKTHQNDVIYTKHGGTVSITGGTFLNDGNVWTLNQNDATGGAITVTGGTFHNWNPEDNVSEGPNTNFVAKGYKATSNEAGTIWTVAANMIFEMHLTDANGEAHWLSPMRSNDPNSIIETSKIWYESLQGTYDFTLKVLEDYEVDETILATFPMTIDLCGNKLTASTKVQSTPVIRVLSDVTVKNGTIDGTNGYSCYAFIVGNSTTAGELTIENGTYKGDTTAISVTKGVAYVKGGTFSVAPSDDGSYEYLLNCIDANYNNGSAAIVVTGGTFYGFNPENNAAEGAETNFCAQNYFADEVSTNVFEVKDYVAWVQAELLAGRNVKLERDIVINDYHYVHAHEWPSNGNGKYDERHGNGAIFHVIEPNVTLDLNGHDITWNAHDDDYCNKRQVSLFMVTVEGNAGDSSSLTVKDSVGNANVRVYGMGTAMYVVCVGAKADITGGTWTNCPCNTCKASNIFMYPSHGGTLCISAGIFQQKESDYLLGWKGSSEETTNNGVGVDYDETKVSITGGTFVGFNPEYTKFFDVANSGQETINGVAEGYKAVETKAGSNTWVIKPLITVTFDNIEMVYGNPMPEAFNYTTNFTEVADDGMMLVVSEPSFEEVEKDEAGNLPVGEYEITAEAYVFMSDDYAVEVVPGTLTVQEANVEMDGIYYNTIKDALWTLKSADTTTHTVTVLKDHDIDVNYSTYNYPILVNGFSVILDLNGKTITADWSQYTGSRADNALIGVCNGGKLDVIDSAGGGKIVNNDTKENVENRIFWIMTSTATKSIVVNIKGGTFIQNDVNTALLYVQGNKPSDNLAPMYVNITGGYFETVNDDFFNAYDGYQHNSYITGGTYNKNPEDHEIKIADTHYVKDNGNGTWTVLPKKTITVKFDDVTMVEGNELPKFTYTTNFTEVSEEGEMLVVEEPVVEVNGVGEYEITAEAYVFMSDAYAVEVIPGKLTVEACVVKVNGIAYSSWASAMEANDTTANDPEAEPTKKDYNLKNAEIELFADIKDEAMIQHRFNGNTTLNLNGHNFYSLCTITVSGTTTITGDGSFDTGTDGWPLVLVGNVKLDPTVEFKGTLQFNTGSTGNLIIGDEYALGNTSKYSTNGSEAYVRVVFANGLQEINLKNGHVTLTKNDGTLENQQITVGENATFTIAENVELNLDATSEVTINGTVDGKGTIVVNSAEHLAQVLASTKVENIKLGCDITADDVAVARDVTIDLNGKTLKGNINVTEGKLMVVDSSITTNYTDAGSVTGTITGSAELYAGNYNYDVADLCAENHMSVKDAKAEGIYTVMKGIVTVNGVPYVEWDEAKAAIKAIKDDRVVVLYADIVNTNGFTFDVSNKELKLDLNGHSFTTDRMGTSSHHTLHFTDSAEGGSVKVNTFVGLYVNGYLNVDSNVDFDGVLQLLVADGEQKSTGCFMVDGTKWIGRGHFQLADGIVGTTGGYVTLKDGFMNITFTSGGFVLNQSLETLEGQSITIGEKATLEITEGVTLTINAGSTIDIEGTVNGEGTVVVNTIDHFEQILGTDIVNINLGSEMTLADALTIEKDVFVTGMANLTITGTLTLKAGTYDKDVNEYCAEGYVADNNGDGTWTVREAKYVAQIVDAEGEVLAKYESVAEAIEAAEAGQTIELLADVTEDVTVNKSLTIDGKEFKYTGNISVSGISSAVTIKKVNFVDGTGYAITTNRIKSITVENCTVSNYGFGFLYANKSTPTVVVKNVTVTGGNYGFHWVYGTSATLENVTMTNVINGLYIQNYAGKTITVKNSTITSINIWERDGYSGVQTFKFDGANKVDTLTDSTYAKYVLNSVTSTLTAPEGYDVTTSVEGYKVVYEEGVYKVVPLVYVAQIGEEKYETLQAAIDAAEDNDEIVLLENLNVADEKIQTLGDKYNTLYTVAGKTVTINLNGKTISGAYAGDSMLVGVFSTENGGHLTLTGNGTVDVTATGTVYSLLVAYDATSSLTIQNGTYTLDKASDSLIYYGGKTDGAVTVKGGTFTLGNLDDANAPWIFNVLGAGDHHVLITGGTFNADINRQKWSNEAVVDKTCYVVANDNGTWTVKEGAVAYVNTGMLTGPYFAPKDVGYETIEEAFEAAVDFNDVNITLLKDVQLTEDVEISIPGIVLNANGKTLDCGDYEIILTAADATLKAAEGLNVTTNLDGHAVVYEDGMYKVVKVLIQFEAIEVSAEDAQVLRLKFSIDDDFFEIPGAYAVLTEEENPRAPEQVVTYTVDQIRALPLSKGRYVFEQGIAAGEMTGDVTITFYDGEGKILYVGDYSDGEIKDAITRTVVDYATLALEKSTDAKQRALVAAMVTYGGYAQLLFKVDVNNPAFNILDEQLDLGAANVDAIKDMTITNAENLGVKAVTQQADLQSNVYLRTYFRFDSNVDITAYTFTVTKPDGTKMTVTPVLKDDGRYYVDVYSPVARWDNDYTITVTNADGESCVVTGNILAYAKRGINSGKATAEQVNTFKAMILYNEAANAYFGK